MDRAEVKVKRPRGGDHTTIRVRGVGGQAATVYISGSDDIMRIIVRHDEVTEVEEYEVPREEALYG